MKKTIKITPEKLIVGLLLIGIECLCIFMLYSSFVSSSIFYTAIHEPKKVPLPFWFLQIICIVAGVICIKAFLYIFRFREKELIDLINESKREINNHAREMKKLDDNIQKYYEELKELK